MTEPAQLDVDKKPLRSETEFTKEPVPKPKEPVPTRKEPVLEVNPTAQEKTPLVFPHAWESPSSAVVLDQNQCLIRYTEDGGSGVVVTVGTSTCLFAAAEGDENDTVFYYEVEVLGLAVFSTVTVGFSNVSNEMHGVLPGKYAGSVGFLVEENAPRMDGHWLFLVRKWDEVIDGIFVVYGRRYSWVWTERSSGEVFFTKNGSRLDLVESMMKIKVHHDGVRPCVGLGSVGTSITTNFGSRAFCWRGPCANHHAKDQAAHTEVCESDHSLLSLDPPKGDAEPETIQISSIQAATERPRIHMMKPMKEDLLLPQVPVPVAKDEEEGEGEHNRSMLVNLATGVHERLKSIIHATSEEAEEGQAGVRETVCSMAAEIEKELEYVQEQLDRFGEYVFEDETGDQIRETVEVVDQFMTNFKQTQSSLLNLLKDSTDAASELRVVMRVQDKLLRAIDTVERLQKQKSLQTFFKIQQPFAFVPGIVNVSPLPGQVSDNCNVADHVALYISKLLEVLRKNSDDNARVNAALALVHLIRYHDDMQRVRLLMRYILSLIGVKVRVWSHLKCCATGALKYLLYVFKSSAAARSLPLKSACASAVRALATCPWELCAKTSMREAVQHGTDGDPYTPCSDLIDMSSSWSVLIELLTPFESELVDVVNAVVFLSSSPCRCCGVESCAFEMREDALALANLSLVFFSKDHSSRLNGTSDDRLEFGGWSEVLAKSAVRYLVVICTAWRNETSSSLTDTRRYQARIEALHFAMFSLSRIAQYPAARLPMMEGSIQGPLKQGLRSNDEQVILLSLVTLVGMCSGKSPFAFKQEKTESTADLYTTGYISAKLSEAGMLEALVRLTTECVGSFTSERVRMLVLPAFSFLSTQTHCREQLIRLNGFKAFLELAYLLCREKTGQSFSTCRKKSCPAEFDSTTAAGQELSSSEEQRVVGASLQRIQSCYTAKEPILLPTIEFASLDLSWDEAQVHVSTAIFWFMGGERNYTRRTSRGRSLSQSQSHKLDADTVEAMFMREYGGNILRVLSRSTNPTVKLNVCRTAHLLSQQSDELCEAMVKAELVPMVIEFMVKSKTAVVNREAAELAEVQVVACGILGNLANSSFTCRAMLAKSDALQVAIAMLSALYVHPSGPSGSDIEIAHQTVRVIAGIAELAPGNYYEYDYDCDAEEAEGDCSSPSGDKLLWRDAANQLLFRFDKILELFQHTLESPANIVISETCRALAALARSTATSWHKKRIVQKALEKFVNLAARSDIFSSSLQKNAEDALIAIGFTEGLHDVAVCNHDVQSMYEWFCIDNALEMQPLVHAVLLASSVAAWRIPITPKIQQRLDDVIHNDSVGHSLAMYSYAQESAQPTPISSRKSIRPSRSLGSESLASVSKSLAFLKMGPIQRLMACRDKPQDDAYLSSEEEAAAVDNAPSPTPLPSARQSKEPHRDVASFLGSILEINRIIKGGGQDAELISLDESKEKEPMPKSKPKQQPSSPKDPAMTASPATTKRRHSCRVNDRFSMEMRPGTQGLEAIMPPGVARMLRSLFPSRLQRRQMMFPYGEHDAQGRALARFIPTRPLAVLFPSRTYFSFRAFFACAISRLMDKYGNRKELEGRAVWSLCFKDCDLSGDFHQRLVEHLHRLPSVSSITFAKSRESSVHTTSPPSPTSAAENERKLIELFRDLPASVEWCCFDNVITQRTLRCLGASLAEKFPSTSGIAVRNCRLAYEDISPLIGILKKLRNKRQMDRQQLQSEVPMVSKQLPDRLSLRFVDLSGNVLRDDGCAKVIEAVAYSETIVGLDLSNNKVGKAAKETIAILSTLKLRHEEYCFTELHLAENGIGGNAGAILFQCIASPGSRSYIAGSLSVLNLEGNRLEGPALEKSLVSAMAVCSNLHDLDLSGNLLTAACVKLLAVALEEHNSVLHFLGLRDIISMDISVPSQDILSMERALFRNREAFYNLQMDRSSHQEQVLTLSRTDSTDSAFGSTASEGEDINPNQGRPIGVNQMALSVLFSVPLALVDNGRVIPLHTLNYKQEQDHLWASFANAQRDVDLRFGFATVEQLRAEVSNNCRAIHFSGHGAPGVLFFEDGRGGVEALSAEMLRMICSAGDTDNTRNHLEFVFVSACHSEHMGQAFVNAGVPHVVCAKVEDRVLDRVAQSFSKIFYHSLANGHTVQHAFDVAQRTSEYSVGSSRFLLLPADTDHNVPIFPTPKPMLWSPLAAPMHPQTYQLWKVRPPNAAAIFIGRKVEQYITLNTVLSPSHIAVVTGREGVGKSELCRSVAQYVQERGLFRDGVLFLRMETRVHSIHQLVLSLLCSFTKEVLHKAGLSLRVLRNELLKADPANSLDMDLEELGHSLVELLRFRKTLIVLDHCDTLFETPNSSSEFELFLGKLKDGASSVQLLISSRSPIFEGRFPGFPVKTIALDPLKPRDAASLFIHLCPHSRGVGDLQVAGVQPSSPGLNDYSESSTGAKFDMLASLAEDGRIRAAENLPKEIAKLAYSITATDYNRLIDDCQNVVRRLNSVFQ